MKIKQKEVGIGPFLLKNCAIALLHDLTANLGDFGCSCSCELCLLKIE